jgi:hypothetical protein
MNNVTSTYLKKCLPDYTEFVHALKIDVNLTIETRKQKCFDCYIDYDHLVATW